MNHIKLTQQLFRLQKIEREKWVARGRVAA